MCLTVSLSHCLLSPVSLSHCLLFRVVKSVYEMMGAAGRDMGKEQELFRQVEGETEGTVRLENFIALCMKNDQLLALLRGTL